MTDRDAPDLEDLAAYFDGRLSGEKKARVEEHLLRDEDYFDVFLENVSFREEKGKGESKGMAPVVWWKSRRGAAPLAAAAALVAAVGLWQLNRGPTASELAARLDAARIVPQEPWDDRGWSNWRGASDLLEDRLEPEEIAFRMGALTIDLQLAMTAADLDVARSLTGSLEVHAVALSLFGVSATYRTLGQKIDGSELDAIEAEAEDIRASLLQSVTPAENRRFRVGAWTETGRLAAHTEDAEVLRGTLRHSALARSFEKIEPQLAALGPLAEPPDPDSEGFAAAIVRFQEIAKALGG